MIAPVILMCLNLTLDPHSQFLVDEEETPEFALPPPSASAYLSRVYQAGEEILIPYTWHSTNPDSVIVPCDPVDESDDEDEDFDPFLSSDSRSKCRRLFKSPPRQ